MVEGELGPEMKRVLRGHFSSRMPISLFLMVLGIAMLIIASISYYTGFREENRKLMSWEIGGFFSSGDIIQLVIKPNNDWGRLITDEVEVAINLTFSTPEGETKCTAYYWATPSTWIGSSAPSLELINVTAFEDEKGIQLNTSTEGILGGIVKKTGYYNIKIDNESVWRNFRSKEPPAVLILYKNEFARPYSILTFPAIISFFLGLCVLLLYLKRSSK